MIRTETGVQQTTATVLRGIIEGRRSVGKVHPAQPPRELIEQILDAATWAPNHRLTEPWRFVVLAGDARHELGRIMGEQNAARFADDDPRREIERERGSRKALRAPVIIAVAAEPVVAANVEEIEEIEAVACAVQNMLLTAHALGLGAKLSTGAICTSDEVKSWLGFSPRAHIVGFIYVGYPAVTATRAIHTPAAELTVWRGWDEQLSVGPDQAPAVNS